MDKLQNSRRIGKIFGAALVAAALSGCGTSRQQPPVADANVVAAPDAVQPIVKEAKARSAKSSTSSSPETSSNKTTAAILSQIHQVNLNEIAIGKVAEEKASSSEVRAYADQLVQDHTNVDQMVVAMAQKDGVHLRNSVPGSSEGRREGRHGKLVEQKLSSASGAAFDRRFLQQTSSDHERLMRSLQQDREDASDDDVEALIDKIMPILQQHRDLAQILMKKEQA